MNPATTYLELALWGRFICGICHESTYWTKTNLTLTKAIEITRNIEVAKTQASQLKVTARLANKILLSLESYNYYMWLDLPNGVLYQHSFKSHFSQPFNRYNNRLNLYHCQSFNSLLLLRLYLWACLTSMGAWVVCKWLQLPSQADSQQEITTRLAGETGPFPCF